MHFRGLGAKIISSIALIHFTEREVREEDSSHPCRKLVGCAQLLTLYLADF
jgi:hypothetical protein